MAGTDCKVKVMTKAEVESFLPKFYQLEKWSYGVHDFSVAYEHDPMAFLCCEVNGQIVATVSGFKWDNTYGFVSALYVPPENRKKGYAVKLIPNVLSHLSGCNIGIDSVEYQVANYEKGGFVRAYDHYSYMGIAKHADHPLHTHICELSKVPFEDLVAYDSQHFPVARGKFLNAWIKQPNFIAYAFVQGGQLMGYGALKEGWPEPIISPLYAASPDIAIAILTSLVNKLPVGQKYEICVHSPNPNAAGFAAALGLEKYYHYVRMYNKTNYSLPDSCLYACTSNDLG